MYMYIEYLSSTAFSNEYLHSTLVILTQTPSQSPSFTRLESLKILADDGAAGDRFGGSVAVFEDTLVVGAVRDDDKGEYSGSAYIYNKDPTNKEWILQQKLVADDGAAEDLFGVSVAIYEGAVVVGAHGDDDKGDYTGSVYIYNRDPTTKEWILQQKLVADDGAECDRFGSSVAIYDSTVVVGADCINEMQYPLLASETNISCVVYWQTYIIA